MKFNFNCPIGFTQDVLIVDKLQMPESLVKDLHYHNTSQGKRLTGAQ